MVNKNFLISGFVSIFIYFSAIFSFFFILSLKKQENIIEIGTNLNQPIDVVLDDNVKIANDFSAPEVSTQIPKEKPVNEMKQNIEQKQNTKDLFSNVQKVQSNSKLFDDFAPKKSVELPKQNPPEHQNLQPQQIQKKFEFVKEERKSIPSYALNLSEEKTVATFSQSSKKNIDPFLSKIYDLLNQKFKPNGILKNSSSKVNIFIDKNGRFDYFVVHKSQNQNFDNQLFSFLENEKNHIFPIPPDGNKISIEVTFTSKGL